MPMSAWYRRRSILAMLVTTLLLGGMAVQRAAWPSAEQAEAYHQRVAAAIDAVPMRIDDWTAVELPQPPEAVELLRPNRILSRRYTRPGSSFAVDLLIVHCRDVRDMIGPHPPVCYPAHGWTTTRDQPKTYEVGGVEIPARSYGFEQSLPMLARSAAISTVLIRPDGVFHRTMAGLRAAPRKSELHLLGAGQVQLIFHEPIAEAQRRRIVERFLEECLPVFEAIQVDTDNL